MTKASGALTASALSLVAALALVSPTLVSPAQAADDPSKEIATAATHAGLAAKAGDMKTTQMHLHHVVNCLVGPNGAGFDSAPGNPCRGQGNGAIPDTTNASDKARLQQALAKANDGLKAKDMSTAQKNASAAQTLLAQKSM